MIFLQHLTQLIILCLCTVTLTVDFGFTDAVLQWFSSYLTDCTQYVSLSNHCCTLIHVHSGVLGPIRFTMYIKTLSDIIVSHSIIHHSLEDDLQLRMSDPPDKIFELLQTMLSCICDVKAWSSANILRLNDNKAEPILVNSKSTMHLHSLPTSITNRNTVIPFKKFVMNFDFSFDSHLTLNAIVSNIARTW